MKTWKHFNGGHLWASSAAWRLFFVDECGLDLKEKGGLSEIWRNLSMGAGWWWPHELFCIVSPRPDALERDDAGRLHCQDGPALLYPDGWGIWSWHGTSVPREWIEDTENVDVRLAISWQNIEQRRCLAEILGWERVLGVLHPRVVDKDADPMVGELLEVDLPDAPKQQFLRVLCGTGRTFILPCVRNDFGTALEANAASWGEDGIDPALIRGLQRRT